MYKLAAALSGRLLIKQTGRAPRSKLGHELRWLLLHVAEVEHQPVGRLDGGDARRRDRVRVRTPAQPEPAAQPGGEELGHQDDQGLRHFCQARVSFFLTFFVCWLSFFFFFITRYRWSWKLENLHAPGISDSFLFDAVHERVWPA